MEEREEVDSVVVESPKEENESNHFSLPEITDITHVSIKVTEQSKKEK